jgi:hypothetical protein
MTQEKQPSTPSRTTPKQVGRAMAFDSAEHLFAAFPILVAIANWTGRIGVIFIKRLILSGKIKEARRNAAIIAVSLVGIVVLLLAFMMWLALLK